MQASCVSLAAPAVRAQAFRSRPVRLVLPVPADGPVDTVARAVVSRLSEAWGQPVVVDKRAGAGGGVGAAHAAKSAADGCTHLAAELFNIQAETEVLRVPYKGRSPAMADLLKDITAD